MSEGNELELVLEQCKEVVNRKIPLLVLAPEYTKILLDYIEQLQQENQQLKEQLKDENNYHNEAVKWYKEAFDIEQERIKYKSVLDEIREQLKLERKLALSLNKPYTVSVIDKLLDKVKE